MEINRCFYCKISTVFIKSDTTVGTAALSHAQISTAFFRIILPADTTGELIIKAGRQKKANWLKVDRRNRYRKNIPSELNMFHIYLNHGNNPKNDTYAYIVNMRLKNSLMMEKYLDNNPIKILANTPSLQAVAHRFLKVREMIFYDNKSTCVDGAFTMSVTEPAAIIVKEQGNKSVAITVADPRQQESLDSITIHTSLRLTGENVKQTKQGSSIMIKLPKAPYCGKSITKVYNKR